MGMLDAPQPVCLGRAGLEAGGEPPRQLDAAGPALRAHRRWRGDAGVHGDQRPCDQVQGVVQPRRLAVAVGRAAAR
eukprot:2151923-Rhodomonas_salina.1